MIEEVSIYEVRLTAPYPDDPKREQMTKEDRMNLEIDKIKDETKDRRTIIGYDAREIILDIESGVPSSYKEGMRYNGNKITFDPNKEKWFFGSQKRPVKNFYLCS